MKKLYPLALMGALAIAPAFADYRPSLLFREDWMETPPATPLTQADVANPGLLLHRHGPAESQIRKSHHEKPIDDPYYIWSGVCEATWAVSLQPTSGAFDLSTFGKVRWRSKQSGFHELRIIIQLSSEEWFIADQSDSASSDWRIREFIVGELNWYHLDIEKVVEGKPAADVDLSSVAQIGFTDLRRGGRSPSSSRLDWIEVYANPTQ